MAYDHKTQTYECIGTVFMSTRALVGKCPQRHCLDALLQINLSVRCVLRRHMRTLLLCLALSGAGALQYSAAAATRLKKDIRSLNTHVKDLGVEPTRGDLQQAFQRCGSRIIDVQGATRKDPGFDCMGHWHFVGVGLGGRPTFKLRNRVDGGKVPRYMWYSTSGNAWVAGPKLGHPPLCLAVQHLTSDPAWPPSKAAWTAFPGDATRDRAGGVGAKTWETLVRQQMGGASPCRASASSSGAAGAPSFCEFDAGFIDAYTALFDAHIRGTCMAGPAYAAPKPTPIPTPATTAFTDTPTPAPTPDKGNKAERLADMRKERLKQLAYAAHERAIVVKPLEQQNFHAGFGVQFSELVQEELDHAYDATLATREHVPLARGSADIKRAHGAYEPPDFLRFEYGGDPDAYQHAGRYRAWLFAGLYGNADKCAAKVRGKCESVSKTQKDCMECVREYGIDKLDECQFGALTPPRACAIVARAVAAHAVYYADGVAAFAHADFTPKGGFRSVRSY